MKCHLTLAEQETIINRDTVRAPYDEERRRRRLSENHLERFEPQNK